MLKRNSLLLMVGVFLLFLLAPALSAAESIDELRNKAEQGDSEAQFELGEMYLKGEGVDKDTSILKLGISRDGKCGLIRTLDSPIVADDVQVRKLTL